MAIVHPFRALRPQPARVADVAAVPYDVVSRDEARALVANNPYSLLHVTRPDVDLPDDTPPEAELQYQTARANLERLIREAPLLTDEEAGFFVYRLVMAGRAQTGIVGVCAVDDYDRDMIRKHEKTRPDKEDDRTRHLLALGVHTEPVFLAYRDVPALEALVAQTCSGGPLYDFTAEDGIQHTVWRMPETDQVRLAFADVPTLYVADGHHRSASASRARAVWRAQDPHPSAEAPYNFFWRCFSRRVNCGYCPTTALSVTSTAMHQRTSSRLCKPDASHVRPRQRPLRKVIFRSIAPAGGTASAFVRQKGRTSWRGWMSAACKCRYWSRCWALAIPVRTGGWISSAGFAARRNWNGGSTPDRQQSPFPFTRLRWRRCLLLLTGEK